MITYIAHIGYSLYNMEEKLKMSDEGLVKRLNKTIDDLKDENERLRTVNRVLNVKLNNCLNSKND